MTGSHHIMGTVALWCITSITLLLGAAPDASAFCGFYVSSGSSDLYSESTQVALMRHETTTILSMRNSYKGPAEDFAMVVPVPIVLKKDEVVTLDDALFDKLDKHTAPRLVEYWEQDPCWEPPMKGSTKKSDIDNLLGKMDSNSNGKTKGGVKVEAKFEVDEYEVVILSAKEATGLEEWLTTNKYNIPTGASEVLQSYIAQGMYFFVAKVNVDKVELDKKGRAMLSPLRFHYESEDFQLPVRLGLLNADGPQDLLIHILAEDRHDVANYPNAFIPTNLIVKEQVKKSFGLFYRALFDYALKQSDNAVITEYAWQANFCDPCPTPAMRTNELGALGLDVIMSKQEAEAYRAERIARVKARKEKRTYRKRGRTPRNINFVITRLHARYTAKQLEQDLIFQVASPITGGRGIPEGKTGKLDETGAVTHESTNQFQGRYIVLNTWEEKLTCKKPTRYNWGRPPSGTSSKVEAASGEAFGKRKGIKLSKVIKNEKAAGLIGLK